ncbi:hypothetical protein HWV07_11040 [Natronomonas salina]|uniref:hypothetical protein n=1 Tax=Natronomonas salina TaxID=1710540 RepID=UPI0015B64CB5|nr:hypothetical protein [Natronomonas salina]QLD89537.1 hypothetical protein HWV07_11040 [Natronomonas salina]
MVVAIALVGTAFVGVGAIGAVGADQAEESDDEVRIVDEHVEINDGLLTIDDTTIEGPGLGERHIEDRKYTIDSTMSFDGFHVNYDGTEYTFCRITVELNDIGVQLENVTLTEGE